MREWCGCGAGIKGKPKQVTLWREHHRHSDQSGPDLAPTSGTSLAENTWPSIGFRPETEA